MKIRKLKRKDRVTMSRIVKKLAERVGAPGLLNSIRSDVDTGETTDAQSAQSVYIQYGIDLLRLAVDVLDTDVAEWFADLAGVKVADLDDMPLEFEVDVINQIVTSEEAECFFTQALRLYKKTRGFAERFSTKRTESDITVG